MALTVSLVFLFGLVLFLLLRFNALGSGAAFVAVMFGFYLASTGAAPTIHELTLSVATAVQGLTN